ncbi:MAG: tetratricopeptide repeat protein, partial [Pyrinomonadaceae bacterium]
MLHKITSHEETDMHIRCGVRLFIIALLLSFMSFASRAQQITFQAALRHVEIRARTVSMTQDAQETLSLEKGKAVERNLAGGQAHTYRLPLESDQYLHLTVEQKGIDVALLLFAPDNRKIAEVDVVKGPHGPEPLKLMTTQAGDYRLEVRAQVKDAAAAPYEVEIRELRSASAQDGNRIAAYQLYLEGAQLLAQGTTESRQGAVRKFQEMLPLLRAAGDRLEEAETLSYIGIVYRESGESQKALDYFNQRRLLFHEMGERREEAGAFLDICYYYIELGEFQKSLECHKELLPLYRGMADREGEATTLATIGLVYWDLSDYQQALDFNNQALQLSRAAGNRSGEALALANLGLVYNRLGEPQKALDHYTQALPIFRSVGEHNNEVAALHNIGTAYKDLGEYQKALDYLNRALPLFRDMHYRLGEGHALYNIGMVYSKLGDAQKALDYFKQALTLFRAVGNPKGEANALTGTGVVHQTMDEPQRALDDFKQALTLFRTIGDSSGEANALYNIARSQSALGNFDAARPAIEAALSIIESLRSRIISRELRASYFASVQDYYEAYIDLLMRLHKLH